MAENDIIRYPNPKFYHEFYIPMVLQKHKISQNILQDMRTRPTRKKKLNLVLTRPFTRVYAKIQVAAIRQDG